MWPYINHVPQPAIFVEYRPFFGRPVQQQQIYNPFPPLQPAFTNYQYFQTNPQQIIILPQNKPNEKTKVPKHIKEIDKNQVKQFYFSNNKSHLLNLNKMGRHVTQEKILYNLLINKVECFMVGLQIVQIYHQLKWSGRT